MSTSILYHGWGLVGYDYRSTRYEGGAMIFCVEPKDQTVCCPECGREHVVRRGAKVRQFRALPIGNKPVFIEARVQRVFCEECKIVRPANLRFADPRVTYTRQVERFALDLLRSMTIQDVARHLGLSWDTVKDIQKRDLQARFARPPLRKMCQRRLKTDPPTGEI